MPRALGYSNAQAFAKVWRIAGKPTAKFIKPIAAWTLPVGVTYSARYDQFVNGSGAGVTVNWATQPATTVRFLPGEDETDAALVIPGVSAYGTTLITLLWDSTIEATVKDAWGVQIGSRLYRVAHWQVSPLGAVQPFSVVVNLHEDTNAST